MIRAELTLQSSTPMLVGWYDPRLADPRGLRETELKGIWRYWVRVTVAGALYDKGMLTGQPGKGVLRVPRKEEGEAIACYTGKIMGLGHAGSGEAEQSRFRIRVESAVDPESRTSYRDPIQPGAKFKVAVEQIRSRYRDAEEVAMKILIFSLQLQGVGKRGRRGFGSLDLQDIYITQLSMPEDLRGLVDEIYSGTLDVVTRYKGVCARDLHEGKHIEHLPPLPSLSKKIHGKGIPTLGIYSVGLRFSDVRNFFLKIQRNSLIEWFLGLPRPRYIAGSVKRRASPIYVGYHERGNRYGAGAILTFSLSADWPSTIKWKGAGSQGISIDDQKILKAHEIAFSELEAYVKSHGKSLSKVWP